MVQIVATDDLARQLEKAEGIIDARGNRLGNLTRSPTDEDIRVANDRRAANRPGMTIEQLVNRLNAIKSE